MKVKELIKISNVIMKMLHERGIGMDYYQHLPMVEEFDIMKDMGHKTTYIVAHLSEKYGKTDAKLNAIIAEVEAIKRCQPPTITLPNNQYTAVPTFGANIASDFLGTLAVARLLGLSGSTTTGTTETPATK